jgi:hypothetical protein
MSAFTVRFALEPDYITLANYNLWMAKETEDKDLNEDLVR